MAGGDQSKRNLIYKKWRNAWIEAGMPWTSVGIEKPKDWDPTKQIKMSSQPEGLISVLLDESAREDEKHDAAMDLAFYPSDQAIEVIYSCGRCT